MKKNYLILFIFFSLSAFLNSQNFRGNWNVVSLESNGNIINLPSTVTTPPNIDFGIGFSSPPPDTSDEYYGSYVNGNGICNSFVSYYEDATGNAISLIPYFDVSNNSCNTSEETTFENLYFSILQESGNLNYIFSDDLHELSIINSLGEVINLGREDDSSNQLSGEWFLYSIWDYDILLENTFDPSLSIIFSDVENNGQSDFYGNSTCNGFGGTYDNPIQDSTFIKRSINWTLSQCNTLEEEIFESSYLQFFETNGYFENILEFEITGSGSDAILYIYNGYGSDITYGRLALSINNFEKSRTQILTNLTENKLKIISDTVLANSSYTIYDMSGRLMASNYLNKSKSITTNNLASGMYFLNIQNSKNMTESFKFLKK
ncbi:T9SS type A sorting domain-containing protein [Winogradskyella forsetii]|uniref:T9SS type A sorting domain-containing protein n=1 Tax=Winogradskyella forsetii TaxID=2686077 RepID=UPI0015BA37F4|nr:T9SS type A sorting domain-containing protein [Winogradskyella forsetii]